MYGDTPPIRLTPARPPAAWRRLPPLAAAGPMDGSGRFSTIVRVAAHRAPRDAGGPGTHPSPKPPGWRVAEACGRPMPALPR
jgi:hypothetical protein